MHVDTLQLLLVLGAIYYITLLLVYEDGPKQVFAKLRRRAGIEILYMLNDKVLRWHEGQDMGCGMRLFLGEFELEREEFCTHVKGFWAQVLACHRCCGFYVTLLVLLIYFVYPPIIELLGYVGLSVFLLERK